jgi:hypothetical protein
VYIKFNLIHFLPKTALKVENWFINIFTAPKIDVRHTFKTYIIVKSIQSSFRSKSKIQKYI